MKEQEVEFYRVCKISTFSVLLCQFDFDVGFFFCRCK